MREGGSLDELKITRKKDKQTERPGSLWLGARMIGSVCCWLMQDRHDVDPPTNSELRDY